MKCVTLRQPWASLVAHGHKRIETRYPKAFDWDVSLELEDA